MVVVGESAGDKRKREQMAESETSSIIGDVKVCGSSPKNEEVITPSAIEPEVVQAAAVSATPQTFASHHTLREHLVEETKRRAERSRRVREKSSVLRS